MKKSLWLAPLFVILDVVYEIFQPVLAESTKYYKNKNEGITICTPGSLIKLILSDNLSHFQRQLFRATLYSK